jgi:hypothetical protein
MARRGRGSSARTKAAPNGRSMSESPAVDGPFEPGDEPGARTIGAMALKRWVARGPGRGDVSDEGGAELRTHGPFDEDDAGPVPAGPERVDFGAVRVPVPRGGEVSVEPEDGRLQAVHVMLPAGRLSVSALAAPRTERLWPDLAAEIDESLREGGATVRSFTGEWGRELHARTGDASSLFVGVDGPRWMLYGVATGPTSAAAELDAALRTMLRGTVVVRGRSPYPVRTVLPLTIPAELPRSAQFAGPDRVPVPRMPADPAALPARPVPVVDAPTTITSIGARGADGVDTVPHGIPRSVPGADDAGPGYRPGPAAPAARTGPAADPAPAAETDAEITETGVSRTASRGLFRRRPERPSSRPSQKRVADLLAQAERDRAAAERAGDDARPARPERRPTNGSEVGGEVGGGRANGYIPRELTHDHPAANGAPVSWSPGADVPDRPATNGTGHAADFGGSFLNGSPHERSPHDEPRVNGSGTGSPPHDAPRFEGSSGAEEWPRGYRAVPDVTPFPGSSDPGLDSGIDRWADVGAGTGDGPAGAIEATVWAMLHDEPRRSSDLAADGSDDWTLPLPVVRPAPAPEPAGPPAYDPPAYGPPSYDRPSYDEAPRGRRARREAEERAAEHRAAEHRVTEQRTPGRWTPDPWSADRRVPDPADRPSDRHREPDQAAPGAHSAERRYTGSDEREPTGDRPTRAARRNGRAQARHAEEGGDLGGHAERARHRRPDH